MTDPAPPAPPAPPRPGRGLKIALALSVALNLGVAGLALGAWLKEGPGGRGLPRELSFGPFDQAFLPEDRAALRRDLIARAPEIRTTRAEMRAELQAVLQALRARPYDPAALTRALAAIETRYAGRLALGRSLIEARLQALDDAGRQAFADRLEDGLRKRN
jgi:uncharacterized membrane protein